jgi:aerobic carbon-monoxide dehydrogenase medium subunit
MFIKRLPAFEYHTPGTVPEALGLMGRFGQAGRLIAGGTDLLVAMKSRQVAPAHLISLAAIDGLKGITFDANQGLRIGSLTTIADIEASDAIKKNYAPLWDAANVMASAQVRNLATIGGNLCSAVPSADTAPPLIALGASVQVTGSKGERTIAIEDFFTGPKACACGTEEIVTAILVPKPAPRSGGSYLKLMRRSAMDLALVGAAACLTLDDKGVCKAARIALAAVAPTPIRVPEVEEKLIGKTIDEAAAVAAGNIAGSLCRPITDLRASLEYRCEMVGVLTKRAVMEAKRRIMG